MKSRLLVGIILISALVGCSISNSSQLGVSPTSSSELSIPHESLTQPVLCQQYFAGLLAGDPAIVKSLENCLKTRENVFKNYPIPHTKDDYYVFMGNNTSNTNSIIEEPSCWFDGVPGCLFYKVIDGVPNFITSLGLPELPFDTETTKSPLLLTQGVGVRDDGVFLFQTGCYEVCFSIGYISIEEDTKEIDRHIYIQYINGDMNNDDTNGRLKFYSKNGAPTELTIETEETPQPKIVLKSLNSVIAEFAVRNSSLNKGYDDNNTFPKSTDLRTYAFHKDLTKFKFSIDGKNHALDLSGEKPALIY